MPPYAVSFQMDHFYLWSLPESLKLSSVAEIYSMGQCLTEANLEIIGDDSIATVPFGKKVFIYNAGMTASRWRLKIVVDIPRLMVLAAQGPPPI